MDLPSPGVNYTDVKPAQLVYRRRDNFVAPVFPCDVAVKFDCGTSFCLYQFDDLLRIVSLCRQIRDGDIGSLTRKGNSSRSTNTATGPDD